MISKYGTKVDGRFVLSGLTCFMGTICFLESPVSAAIEITGNSFKLAQVGVHSQASSPIPLNLRPRTHIPLPRESRSRDDDYGEYDSGYDHEYEEEYEYPHDCKHRHYHHRGNQSRSTVIIINPPESNDYESYRQQNGYIRIIRQD